MSTALYVALAREVPGVDAGSVNGQALVQFIGWLHDASARLDVRSPITMMSVDSAQAVEFLNSKGKKVDSRDLPDEAWFEPEEGIRTVQVLLEHVESEGLRDTALHQDLSACLRVLTLAKEQHVRFHFAVDF